MQMYRSINQHQNDFIFRSFSKERQKKQNEEVMEGEERGGRKGRSIRFITVRKLNAI